jgi:ribosomal protein L11 methyltransferase
VIRLALRVSAEHADLVLAELLELAPAGVEEVALNADGEPLDAASSSGVAAAMVEYAIYGSPGEVPLLPDLRAAAGGVPVEVHTSELADDWSERWKQFHRPVLIEGSRASLHVRAPWMPPCRQKGVEEVVIDPAQAFGTGSHPTTRMCLQLLLELAAEKPERGPVVDVGAGSGVLSIAAAKLGYAPVLALDNDSESVSAIAHNAAFNRVVVQVRRFDLRRGPLPGSSNLQAERQPAGTNRYAPVVLANLLRPLLLDLAGSMHTPPRHLIASGLLVEEADEIAGVYEEQLSLREHARREQGDWAALLLSRE